MTEPTLDALAELSGRFDHPASAASTPAERAVRYATYELACTFARFSGGGDLACALECLEAALDFCLAGLRREQPAPAEADGPAPF